MSNEEYSKWQNSPVKKWLDMAFDAALVGCILMMIVIIAGIDLEVIF